MKLIILICFGVLSSLVVCVLTAGHAERNGFEEDKLQLEADGSYRLFIDNDMDEAELQSNNESVMLANWFKKAGNKLKHWGKKAKKWTKKAENDTGKWTKKAAHDTGKWTKKAAHDTGKWTKKAVKDVGHAVQKGCHVVNLIPVKELVSEMNDELRSRGISEESVDEEQFAAAYEGIKDICKVIG